MSTPPTEITGIALLLVLGAVSLILGFFMAIFNFGTKKDKKIYRSWEDFEEARIELVKEIKESGKTYSGVFAIPRGGLILGVCLAHDLDLPFLKRPKRGCLIVDEISDFGKTLQKYKEKGYDIATWYTSNWTITSPTYYVDIKTGKNKWIIFSWEKQNES